MPRLTLDGTSLDLDALTPILDGADVTLALAKPAKARVRAARKVVEDHVAAGDVVYGLTTGFGKLKSVAIDTADLATLQRNLILSHCTGVGAPMPLEEVRVVQVLRLNGILRGHSGVRLKVVEQLTRLFNKGFVPEVPMRGSVGASGDLAPLSHMAATYMGVGHAFVMGPKGAKRMTAKRALALVGEEPLEFAAKEGLALINGTEVIKACLVRALRRAANLSKAADAITSLTIEALFGSVQPFDDRFAQLKGQPGHTRTSANVRACLKGSSVLASHVDCDRVQDPYSLRCVPQVHGAFKAALAHVTEIVTNELCAVTDNPILFPDTGEVISAGQFHGQPLSMVADYLALSLCTVGNISERRIEQLVNPDLSELPAFLTPQPGLNSGMMIAQVTAAALVSECKGLAHPASVDTVPTSANQEDHVSMGMGAARKVHAILDNVEAVLGIELMCAGQAREFHKDLEAGRGAEAARALLRTRVKPLGQDRYLHPDLEACSDLVASGALVAAVEAETGRLEA
ncbi:MAG: histidine ammonia-lyase [Planctomycetota bacterium]|nr:histidine ammonia-lyase [Planctomycetota bacterium]